MIRHVPTRIVRSAVACRQRSLIGASKRNWAPRPLRSVRLARGLRRDIDPESVAFVRAEPPSVRSDCVAPTATAFGRSAPCSCLKSRDQPLYCPWVRRPPTTSPHVRRQDMNRKRHPRVRPRPAACGLRPQSTAPADCGRRHSSPETRRPSPIDPTGTSLDVVGPGPVS